MQSSMLSSHFLGPKLFRTGAITRWYILKVEKKLCPYCNYQKGEKRCYEEKNIICNTGGNGKIQKKGEILENGCVFVINGLKLKGLLWNGATVAKEFEPQHSDSK